MHKLSIINIMELNAVDRFQIWLDTDVYDANTYNKTWDMLAWLKANNNN